MFSIEWGCNRVFTVNGGLLISGVEKEGFHCIHSSLLPLIESTLYTVEPIPELKTPLY